MKGKNSVNIAVIIIFSVLIFFIGCGGKGKKKSRKLMGMINSFETLPSDTEIGDLDWQTNGYVELEQFKKYSTRGKYSARATFAVPSDFLSTTKSAKVKSWFSSMTMGINTLTKLKVTDWSLFKKFAVDIYVPDNRTTDFFIKIVDVKGREYTALRPLKSGRNKLEVILEDTGASRIDLKNIVSFSLYMDTKNTEKDITLFIDNVRLVP